MGKGLVVFAPGVIFTDENAVVPDVVWISQVSQLSLSQITIFTSKLYKK
jgi:hypothetical protein